MLRRSRLVRGAGPSLRNQSRQFRSPNILCLYVVPQVVACAKQGRRDSNPQPSVLETDALPIAPLPFGGWAPKSPDCQRAGLTTGAAIIDVRLSRDGPVVRVVGCRTRNRTGFGGQTRTDAEARMRAWKNGPMTAPARRVSARLAAIAPSATLAVDAKAKALKAAGRPVIGFGAGEPDFPTPGLHRRGRGRRRSRPQEPPLHARDRTARTARGDRGQDPARLAATRSTPRTSSSPTAASRPCSRPSPPSSTTATRSSCPRRTGPPTPRRFTLAGGHAVEVFAGADQDYLVTVEQLEAARTPNTKALLFCSPSNPTGAVYSPEQTKAIGEWALEHGIWVHHRRDLRAPHLRRRRLLPHRARGPRARRPDHRGQRRRQDLRDDRMARGLDDLPRRRHQGRRELPEPPHEQRRERVAARGDRRARGRARGRRTSCARPSTVAA